ncbi:stromal interaction molecule 1-like [Hydractinia symbiolongicarpus]|uniref:stromal interaction molecule 1-like n=1 Tax=Hydractinia symbiolongicarpus TaxID=13093 RepID=UPI00254E4101|nr:stromal interaction molecule 1-like [Hydractinia symbiolongicarpus]
MGYKKYILVFLLFSKRVLAVSDTSFDAIKDVHQHLDDDHDGNIDTKESANYVETESEAPVSSWQSSFHEDDSQVSVDDLWRKWTKSKVYKWSINDVIHWLRNTVKLPEYEKYFIQNKIDGTLIPRLATPKTNFVQKVLKVGNANHRKKIYLRATDLVLFGPPEDEKVESTKLEMDKNFLAIKAVHAHLDDDRDGNIDTDESVEYMRDELEETSTKRISIFHNNDNEISVDDLWKSWQKSEVYNWTTDQVIQWLKITVGLPQYEKNFREKNIDGKSIPRIATDTTHYLQKELGVSNPTHRRKIYLRSSDIILFGVPEVRQSYFNDTIVLIVVLLASLVCVYSFRERTRTRKLMEHMSKDMESLQQAESTLKNMQESLEDQRRQSGEDNSDRERELLEEIESAKKEAERLRTERGKNQEEKIKLSLVEQELSEVRLALAKAELEMNHCRLRSPKALQQWLQMTYKKEAEHFQYKKRIALTQMEEAKEACDKVSKTRRSVFGSLRLAHGQTIDSVDQKILDARSALAEVTNDLQERQVRWRNIEEICNFNIANDGLLAAKKISERKSSIGQYLADVASFGLNSVPCKESPRSIRRNSGQENNLTDSEVENLTSKRANVKETEYTSSPESEKSSKNNISEGPQPSASLIQESKTFKIGRDSPVQFIESGKDESNQGRDMLRSASDYTPLHRSPERVIMRAQTEPNNMSRMAFMNGKFRQTSEQRKNENRKSLDAEKEYSGSRIAEFISSQELNRSANNSDCEDISYLSDDSISSSASTVHSKKKRVKGSSIRRLFNRKSKSEKFAS